MQGDESERERLYTEQVRQLYVHEPVGLIATLVNASILIFIQWRVISHSVLLMWFSLILLITLTRALHFYRYRRVSLTPGNARRWGNSFIIGIGISGIAWGAGGIFLFPENVIAHQIFPAFILGGMVAGATAAFSALKMAFFAYTLPALIPIIIKFFTIADNIHAAMGIMTLLFLILMIVTALRIHKMGGTSLMLGFENKSLVDYLSKAKQKAETMNKILESEILERKKAEEALKRHQDHLEAMVEERTGELRKANIELNIEITERKQVEEALRESEEKYRLLVDNANDAIFIAQDGVIKFPNPTMLQISGFSADELAKIPFVNLIHPGDRDMVLDRHTRRLKGEDVCNNYTFRIITKAGKELYVSINVVLIKWERRPASLNFLRDITEQKKLEEQFQLAQKMESIGTLAGGVAHDFNNLLMGIQGNLSLLLLDLPPTHPNYQMIKRTEEYVKSGAELTKQLLGIAKGGKYEVKPTDLNKIIKQTSAMFGRTKKEIKIHPKLQKKIWPVEVDQGQIEQVLLNLYINAWQAMPGGGTLYLETENIILDRHFGKSYNIEPGDYVKISVTDTGIGMDETIQQRLFDPFFTTKEMGRGTGLGLASVYSIIKSHNGIITVHSEKGKGATFTIYLSASKKKVRPDKRGSKKLLTGTGTILLVDDEAHVADVGKQMLQRMGFKVLVAKSGKEAIKKLKENKDEIDLVILDIIMPGMAGKETYDMLKEINPDIKILLSSGYSMNGGEQKIMEKDYDGFIQKPFGVSTLSIKLGEILKKK
ncbi:MAG: PAS domain S-box protein [Candidatus Aminicenantes bacterium]|nr:PAS domain S-box protein [Candidatus Aminicenantes bacterium]NIM83210.1 PAS domain S-box protein [Candidatus Aminicenantes bacterium]NIN22596.1 PAS domain S-box protein [Candidatus Aminicenantes bacterium]NIN46358.1 PAS domain S-box protein [Candidatus Aminicenantes bacterium]NIN89206.1 PAS domain S-box protein [Candidatus Aminicenantes bacterium]